MCLNGRHQQCLAWPATCCVATLADQALYESNCCVHHMVCNHNVIKQCVFTCMHLPLAGWEKLGQEQAAFQGQQAADQADLTKQQIAVDKREEGCAEAEVQVLAG